MITVRMRGSASSAATTRSTGVPSGMPSSSETSGESHTGRAPARIRPA